ncbi:LysE family translocator [Methyloversatilis thermotolerans]|uniref:LysE family translocator n=1 Tax=Methyloversatilis thermotolerans TaxID=1346290 RepID=UPI00036894FA|nr:LysE family translocator [Methyloversatilis thermotolerans]
MIPANDLALFVAASIALAIAPGPDNLFVLAQSALHGVRAGLLITLGLCCGLLVHIAAVALGVAALFQTSALAFNLLRFAGAAYLLLLAWQAFRASAGSVPQDSGDGVQRGAGRLFTRGVVMNVSNPKVAIFFLAFLPQFADPARGPVPAQLAVLGLVFMACALIVFLAIAWMAGKAGVLLRRSISLRTALNRVAAAVFASLAVRLIVTRS